MIIETTLHEPREDYWIERKLNERKFLLRFTHAECGEMQFAVETKHTYRHSDCIRFMAKAHAHAMAQRVHRFVFTLHRVSHIILFHKRMELCMHWHWYARFHRMPYMRELHEPNTEKVEQSDKIKINHVEQSEKIMTNSLRPAISVRGSVCCGGNENKTISTEKLL